MDLDFVCSESDGATQSTVADNNNIRKAQMWRATVISEAYLKRSAIIYVQPCGHDPSVAKPIGTSAW
jgi:hypothetical protein